MPDSLSGNLLRLNASLQQICAAFVTILRTGTSSPGDARKPSGMTEHEHPEGITELVDALLEGYAPISGLLAHMFESPNEPSVDEVRDVLGVLLCDVLEPLALSYDASE